MRLLYRTGVTSLLGAALWACGGGGGGGSTTPNPNLTVAKVSGDSQVADAGTALPAPLVVIVTDDKGAPVSGQTVTWSVSGGGSVTPGASTGADGKASATRTLGPNAGIQTTSAKVGSGTPFVFTNISHIQGATQIQASGGNTQNDTVLSTLAPYSVLVEDEQNVPVQNVTVNWTVNSGGGQVAAGTSQTNVGGIAQITATLGSAAGAQVVQASVAGLAGSPVSFSSSGTAGNPTVISLSSGNNQVGPVSAALALPHVVLVKDGHNNPKPGVTVTWKVGQGGGSVSTTSPSTQANGTAAVTRTLGAAPGINSDTASVIGLAGSPVAFTDTAGAVTSISVGGATTTFSPSSKSVTAGTFVKFSWAGGTHNVTWDPGDPTGPTDSPTQSSGSFTVRLTTTGTYGFHCSIHGSPGSGMFGTITVTP